MHQWKSYGRKYCILGQQFRFDQSILNTGKERNEVDLINIVIDNYCPLTGMDDISVPWC